MVLLNGCGYRPHFHMIGNEEHLGAQFIEGPDRIISPQEKITAKVWLMYYPKVLYDNLMEGKEFEIFHREVLN